MSGVRWRCFVAVPLPAPVRAPFLAAVARWRTRPDLADLRWVPDDRWHLTLAFLGAISPEDVTTAAAAVDAAAATLSVHGSELGGVGAFPRAHAARVAWLEAGDPDGALRRAASGLGADLGLRATRFHPHVTLGRARSHVIDLRRWIAGAATESPRAELVVDRIELLRSHLGAGSRYETLHRAPLRATAHA